jgi:hypothetical protein
MTDKATELRIKAEACRRLADMDDDPLRKSLWRELADDWEALAKKADLSAAKRKRRRLPASYVKSISCWNCRSSNWHQAHG